MKICEEHFEREDIKFRLNRKYLNLDVEHKHFDCWPKEFQVAEKSQRTAPEKDTGVINMILLKTNHVQK